jgi:ABC-type transport system substrate-binding protein
MRSASSFWEKYTRARVSRRRVLRAGGIAAAAAGAWALAGCGGESDKNGATTPASTSTSGGADAPDLLNPANPPRPGGRYVTQNSANFGTFDPHTGIQVASAYFPRIYNLLLSQSPTKPGFTFMDLAQAYESPDETTYLFTIRPGVKVAPNDLGVPERDIDGEDVRATFERLKTDSTTNQYSFASKFIQSVSVAGDNVTVRTTQPYAWFIPRVSAYSNTIPPRELLGDPAKLAGRGAGAGAYRLVSLSENDMAVFQRNPNYYRRDEANAGAQLPYVDELEVRVVFDRATQRTAFLSGQTHQYWAADGIEARSLAGYPVARDPIFAYVSLTMNPDVPPWTDARARRAVSRAVNRQQYVDIIYGGDARPNGIVHWPLGDYALSPDELTSTYQPHDPQEARQLAEAVGGVKIKLIFPANTTIQEHGEHVPIFVEQMNAAGIEVEQIPLDFGAWVADYLGRNYDANLALNQIYETPELPLLFHTRGGPFGDGSYLRGLDDVEIEAAVRRANTTLDGDQRIEAVHDAQKLIYSKDPAFLPFVSPYQHIAFSPRLRNIPTGIGTTAYSISTYWLEA